MSGDSDLHKKHPPLNVKSFDTIGDSTAFFQAAGHLLGWGSACGATVLDIGCGGGRSSDTLLKVFPDIERVVAIDSMPTRIEEAKRKDPHRKIEYRLADIENKNSLILLGNKSKIVSFNCFNFVSNDLDSFWNMHQLMKKGGTAAVLLVTSSSVYDVLELLTKHEEWKEYMMEANKIIPKSHTMNRRDTYYETLLKSIGFQIIQCNEMETCFTYSSNEECRDAIFGACPLARVLPVDRKQEFMDYAFRLFMEQNSSSTTLQGLPYLKQRTVSIFFRKPGNRVYVAKNIAKRNLKRSHK